MSNQLQQFHNEEFGQIRVLEIDGQPWFVGKDVAGALGYGNTKDAIKSHVDAEDKRIFQRSENATFEVPPRGFTIINESGLYSLILSSKLPKAKAFKRWVTSGILPSVRKHGAYITDDVIKKVMKTPEFAFQLFQELQNEKVKVGTLEGLVDQLAPKAHYCDVILSCINAVPVSLIAKDYGMSAVRFNRLLHELGIQYKTGGTWLLYQDFSKQGYTKTYTYQTSDRICAVHTCWTQKGRLFLYEQLKWFGILPLIENTEIDCFAEVCQ